MEKNKYIKHIALIFVGTILMSTAIIAGAIYMPNITSWGTLPFIPVGKMLNALYETGGYITLPLAVLLIYLGFRGL